MPISHSNAIRWICAAFGVIPIAFGINCIVNKEAALAFFELDYPVLPDQRHVVDVLMVVYGYRDIFMGLAILAPAYFGNRRALGWIMLSVSSVAFVDGWVCYSMVGKGAMNHWVRLDL